MTQQSQGLGLALRRLPHLHLSQSLSLRLANPEALSCSSFQRRSESLFSGCLLGQVSLLGAVLVGSEMQQKAPVGGTIKSVCSGSPCLTSSVLILLVCVSAG